MTLYIARESSKMSPEAADVDREAAELLFQLSIFGFSQLSESDQREKMVAIRNQISPTVFSDKLLEGSDSNFRLITFRNMFKKFPLSEQNIFLSRVINIFKGERKFGELVSWFSQLEASDQQKVMEKIVHVTDQETTEDSRLERFTQICGNYTEYVYRLLAACRDIKKQINDDGKSNWLLVQSRFYNFFSSFSILWFVKQSADDQRALIEKYSKVIKRVIVFKLHGEKNEDFRLRKFTELCKNARFIVQVDILRHIKRQLLKLSPPRRTRRPSWRHASVPYKLLLQPQDPDRAAELLFHITTFGFSLLRATDQRGMIDNYTEYGEGAGLVVERLAVESEEDHRIRTFTELFQKVGIESRIDFFKYIRDNFVVQRHLCESVVMFRQLSSDDQQEMLKEVFYGAMHGPCNSVQDFILEKLSEESEQDFRLRRFIHDFDPMFCDPFSKHDTEEWARKGIIQPTSENEEINQLTHSRYAEFFSAVAVIWFNARRSLLPMNPIHVLFGIIEDDTVEQLPEESEEDFRLRTFTESFKQLPFLSQEIVVEYIRDTLSRDLGYPGDSHVLGYRSLPEARGPYDHEFINASLPLKRETASSQVGGNASSAQGGGGGGGGGVCTQGAGSSAQGTGLSTQGGVSAQGAGRPTERGRKGTVLRF